MQRIRHVRKNALAQVTSASSLVLEFSGFCTATIRSSHLQTVTNATTDQSTQANLPMQHSRLTSECLSVGAINPGIPGRICPALASRGLGQRQISTLLFWRSRPGSTLIAKYNRDAIRAILLKTAASIERASDSIAQDAITENEVRNVIQKLRDKLEWPTREIQV